MTSYIRSIGLSLIVFLSLSTITLASKFQGLDHTYAVLLSSDNEESIHAAVKSIYKKPENRADLFDIVAELLWLTNQGQSAVSKDTNLGIDTIAWMLKAIGVSGNSKYRDILQQTIDLGENQKITELARLALSDLPVGIGESFVGGQFSFDTLRAELDAVIKNQPVKKRTIAFRRADTIEDIYKELGLPTTAFSFVKKSAIAGGFAWKSFDHLKISYPNIGEVELLRVGVQKASNWYRSLPEKRAENPEWVIFKATWEPLALDSDDLVAGLQTDEIPRLRITAKNIVNQKITDIETLDIAARRAWTDKDSTDEGAVDAYAYICIALGNSKNPRYKTMLQDISKNTKNRKLRKHCKKALKKLPDANGVEQFTL